MKNFLLIGSLFLMVILLGAGCSNNGKMTEVDYYGNPTKDEDSVPTDEEKPPAAAVIPPASSGDTPIVSEDVKPSVASLSPTERGMVRIKVIGAQSKLPVPGVVVVVEHSSENKTTNAEGWVEFPIATGNVYVPANIGYKGSGNINTFGPSENGVITVLLYPTK